MQLIYRGVTYDRSVSNCQPVPSSSGLTRSLFYRGIAYTRHLLILNACPQPIAVNWRYQMSTLPDATAPKLA